MANLVIKPASGSTNKLILQNQAGAVDAITVNDTGNTTLAGTANNIGTVTAGSIAGGNITSATTFPSGTGAAHGHVLQVVYGYTETILSKTSDTWEDLGLSATITPTSSSNHVLCTWVIQAHLYTTNSGFGCRLWRDDGGGYDQIFASASAYDVYKSGGGDNFRLHNTWTNLDTPGVTVATTYKITVANYSASQVTYQDAANRSSLILMEVVA